MLGRKWLRPVTLVGALALTAAACGGGGEGGAAGGGGQEGGDGVLKLGYVLPQTGQLASLGPPQIQATKFAVSRINQSGGVLGNKIPQVVAGDESDQDAVASRSASRVLAQGVDGLIGAAASDKSLAIIDKVTGAQVVQCSGSNTSPRFTNYNDNGYYFRTAPSDAIQGPVLADTIIGDGHTRVAIAARADSYGKGLANATARALEEAGATVTLKQTYDPKSQNFASVVQGIANSNPDAAVLISFEEGTQILQSMTEAGVGPNSIGIYGADGLRMDELPEDVAPGNPGMLASMKGTAPASAENEQFLNALRQFAPDLKEVQFAPQVYDCVNLIALGAQAAGSDDPSAIKEEIVGVTKDGEKCTSFGQCKSLLDQGKNIDYEGVSGPLEFIPAGEPGAARIEVFSYNQQGDLQTLKTVRSELPR